jgi:hypothetical protein
MSCHGKILIFIHIRVRIRVMVFKATFNNISVISWKSVLLVEETAVPGENHRKEGTITIVICFTKLYLKGRKFNNCENHIKMVFLKISFDANYDFIDVGHKV